MRNLLFAIISLSVFWPLHAARAQEKKTCEVTDRLCLMKQVQALSSGIEHPAWRDETLRELAKSYAYEGHPERAIALIEQIRSDDTKAMTIRGIAMAAATSEWPRHRYEALFAALLEKAGSIASAPSREIGYTYIAMAQALAGFDSAGRETATRISNGALKNKAYGEMAEIQAGHGNLENALINLSSIDSTPFRDKEYDVVSGIFLDKALIDEAYVCAGKIENAYLKAKAIQQILNLGNKAQKDLEPDSDLSKGW